MQYGKIERIAVLARPGEAPQQYARELKSALKKSAHLMAVQPKAADLIVFISGDGFFLSAVRTYQHLGKPFLGINFGDVGFFMNPPIAPQELAILLDEGMTHFTMEHFPLLGVTFCTSKGEQKSALAFNEIVVEQVSGQSLHLDIAIDGKLVNIFSGDGIMLSTPQGTTGYAINLGAGAPAVHPGVRCMMLVPINAQKAYKYRSLLFPVILPPSSTVAIRNRSPEKRPAHVVCDGKKMGMAVEARIFSTHMFVPVLYFSDPALKTDYISRLVDKIIGPPRQE